MNPAMTHALPGTDDILRVQLDNGLTVLARENFTSPSVVVEGALYAGANLVSREKAGLSALHSALLMRGTKHHTFNEIFEIIESLGASMDVGGGRHTYSLGAKSLAEDLPTILNLMAEVLQEPIFPETYLETVRGQIMTSLQARAHNTRSMAALTFRELVYPEGHPYRISTSGYLDTMAALTRQDVQEFQQNLGPDRGIIVIVGAVKAEKAVDIVREAFGSWHNPEQSPTLTVEDVSALQEPHIKYDVIVGKTQSDIVLGYPGPARSAPDFQAARLANSVLGVFGMYGRLGDNVREAQGLAYYSYSRLAGGFGPGPWQVIAGIAPQNVNRAVDSIRDEIRRIIDEPVTDEELADNKSFFKGQLLLGLETNEGVAASILNIEKHDLGLDYLQKYRAMVDAITVEDIQAAAQHYLDPDAYALAVAGPEIE